MNQIQQQGKDMLEIVSKYEVPYEYHNALWAAYEAGAEMGFWKAVDISSNKTGVRTQDRLKGALAISHHKPLTTTLKEKAQ